MGLSKAGSCVIFREPILPASEQKETPALAPIHPIPQESAPDPEATVFHATLTPHRSLSQRGLALVMAFVGLAGLAISIPFYLMGAWPVLGFVGLDVLLIYGAFRLNNAAARAHEEIVLSRLRLIVRAVSWRGQVSEWRFNPAWSRIEREEHPEFGTERLEVVEGRRRAEVARALGRSERANFADAFQRALAEAKR
jgi:uncharacterized membrane protein